MLGGRLTYKVDLSKVGCGCLTAFYAVSMPAVDNLDDPFRYCGSGTGAKAACPEYDIMEANKYGFRSTSHQCRSPNEQGIYTDCDSKGQCTVDILETEMYGKIMDNLYGPGPEYKIDTTKPFHVRNDWHEGGQDLWTSFSVTLIQDRKYVKLTDGDCPYLQPSSGPVS